MVRLGQISILTLICCSFPFTASRAFAAAFEITNWTDYVWMRPLPGTLGEAAIVDWSVIAADNGLSGLPGVADHTPVTMSGIANLGPLLSLDAEWYPDGSIGNAEYGFGKGRFELNLMFNLLNGTPHTMTIRGATGPVSISASSSCCGYRMGTSGDIYISFLHAKVDRESAALFGMKRQGNGSSIYHTDVYNMGGPDREIALFGSMAFDFRTVDHSQSSDLTAVPEPGMFSLIGLGVAAAMLGRRR